MFTEKLESVSELFGKASFSATELRENLLALTEAIEKAKPQVAKGAYFQKVSISTTMGPGIRLEASDLTGALS